MPPPGQPTGHNPASAVQAVGAALADMTRHLRDVSAATAVFSAGLNQVSRLVGSISSQVGDFVKLYNPAAFEKFKIAADDAKAAVGKALTPVLEKLTVVVRGVGDALASLSPAGKAMVGALAAATVGMGALTGAAVAFSYAVSSATFGLSAVIGAVVGGLGGMAFVLKDLAGVQEVVNGVMRVATQVMNVAGQAWAGIAQAAMPAIEAVIGTVGRLVQSLLPGVMRFAETFAAVLADLAPALAVVIPAVGELVGAALRVSQAYTGTLAEVFAALARAFGPLREAMAPVAAALGEVASAFADVFTEVGKVLGELAAVFAELVRAALPAVLPLLQAGVEVFADSMRRVAAVLRQVAELTHLLFGTTRYTPPDTFEKDKSRGLSVRDVQTGSVSELFTRAMRTTFAGGGAAETEVGLLTKSNGYLHKIQEATESIDRRIDNFLKAVPAARQVAAQTGRNVADDLSPFSLGGAIAIRNLMARVDGR